MAIYDPQPRSPKLERSAFAATAKRRENKNAKKKEKEERNRNLQILTILLSPLWPKVSSPYDMADPYIQPPKKNWFTP